MNLTRGRIYPGTSICDGAPSGLESQPRQDFHSNHPGVFPDMLLAVDDVARILNVSKA